MQTLNYNIILKPEKEGGFTVIVPSLPGCITYGKNLQEAKAMAEDAIKGYTKSLIKHNQAVPSDDLSYVATVNYTVSKLSKKMVYA